MSKPPSNPTRAANPPKPAKNRETDFPPPEDELGGGDICSVEEQPSTDDDKPLE